MNQFGNSETGSRCRRVKVIVASGILTMSVCRSGSPGLQAQVPEAHGCVAANRSTVAVQSGDSMSLYIEPNAFAGDTHSWMLAGEPLYVWRRGPDGAVAFDSLTTLFGAVFSASGIGTIGKPPVKGFVTYPRLVADDSGFAAIFAETDKPSIGRGDPRVINYWFGRISESGWFSIVRLPLPVDAELRAERATPLIRTSTGYLVVIPWRGRGSEGLAVFTSTAEKWRVDVIPARNIAYVTAALSAGQAHVYVVRPDSTRMPDSNSLSLFSLRANEWFDVGFLIRGADHPVHHPAITRGGGRLALSWQEHDDATGGIDARAALLRSDGILGAASTLRRGITDLIPVQGAGDQLRWIVARHDARGIPTLELIQWDGGEPVIRDVVVDPFTGPSLAYATRQGVAIAGPRVSEVPREAGLATAVLHFVDRCQARLREVP